jgi:hypothetical protein
MSHAKTAKTAFCNKCVHLQQKKKSCNNICSKTKNPPSVVAEGRLKVGEKEEKRWKSKTTKHRLSSVP